MYAAIAAGRSLVVANRAHRLGPAQIRIEGGGITRPAELDFGRDIAEERDFQALATAVAISV